MQLLALIDGEGPWRKKVADAAIKYVLSACPMTFADYPSLGGVQISETVPRVIRICTSTWESYTTKVGVIRRMSDAANPGTDRQFPQAEHHLLASCKRDAASMLAEMMFEWCVAAVVFSEWCSFSQRNTGPTRVPVILERLRAASCFRECQLRQTSYPADGRPTVTSPSLHRPFFQQRHSCIATYPFSRLINRHSSHPT